MNREITPTPAHDAFWIFALWRALHGGDPTLGDVAAAVIASLSQFFPTQEDSFGLPPLPASLSSSLAPEATDCGPDDDADAIDALPHAPEGRPLTHVCYDPRDFSIQHYYFNVNGVFCRLDRPVLACLPTAA